ncbi:MAG: S8 family serine peptidase, partial [Verrucomicrobiota bacterium]
LTGWQVYLEPGVSHTVSAKFKNLPRGEALHILLGKLNFEVSPQTNSVPKLFVFRTGAENATRLIRSEKKPLLLGKNKVILNHLIVTLKPGSSLNIDALAQQLGAKVIGKINGLDSYLLEFPDEASAVAARSQLSQGDTVAAVDSNYLIDRPEPNRIAPVEGSTAGLPFTLKADIGAGDGKQIIIGLVDTGVQQLNANMQAFLLSPLSVVGQTDFSATTPTHGTTMAESMLFGLNSTAGQGNTVSVRILPVDIYGNQTSTSTFDVGNGIIVAANNGANIISVSSGSGGNSSFLQTITDQVAQKNIPIFAAAGNQPVTTPTYPAAYPSVIAVTSSQDQSGTIASYANRGSFVDIILPGATIITFDQGRYYVNGTSVSTALASGMLAGLASSAQQSPNKVLPAFRERTAFRK